MKKNGTICSILWPAGGNSARLRQIIFILSCPVVFLTGCRPEPIDILTKEHEQKLVVSAQIIPHQTMYVSLTKSFSLLNNPNGGSGVSQEFLDKILTRNALVTVSYFNQTDTLQMITPGVYGSHFVLQYEYGMYTLNARDPESGQSITASTVINPLVRFDTIIPNVNISGKDTVITVQYEFTDIPDVPNWYVINFYINKPNPPGANLDISSYFKRGTNKLSEFKLLSDKEISNGKYVETRTLHNVKGNDTIAITLSNISEGYYKFLSTYLKSGNVVNQITGEPIRYPTNVNGGYGYFSAHYPDVRIYDLSKY